NAKESMPSAFLEIDIFCPLVSWGNRINPNKYKARPIEIKVQMIRNGSIFSKPQCSTRSALDKNLNASPSSRNPMTTFTVLSQDPDRGILFINAGKAAKKVNGSASANPNPPMPIVN